MNLVKSFVATALLAAVFVFAYSPSTASGKGNLMGNEAGTKFCCSSGSNDCSAAGCSSGSQEMQ